ncbi:MAG: hypothetical protein H6707_12545 [Deltaproteobacteria bacterium]|nr:hypothetical protein [Deltaproteobacteria bacterium]
MLLLAAPLARAERRHEQRRFYQQLARRLWTLNPIRTTQTQLQVCNQPDTLFGLEPRIGEVARLERRLDRLQGKVPAGTTMPAFERLVAERAKAQRFSGIYVISDLHLVPSMKLLFEALVDSGVQAGGHLVIGNDHSEHPDARRGLLFEETSHRLISVERMNLRQRYRRLVSYLLAEAKADPNARFVVLGHGGRLHAMLSWLVAQPNFPAGLKQRIVVVETTKKGEKRIAALRKASAENRFPLTAQLPFVDIGADPYKLTFESPTIGVGCAKAMLDELGELAAAGLEVPEEMPMLLVGYGNVGPATGRALRQRGRRLYAFDTRFASDRALVERAIANGVTPIHSAGEAKAIGEKIIALATGEDPYRTHPELFGDGDVVFNLASPGELDAVVANGQVREAVAGHLRFGRSSIEVHDDVAPPMVFVVDGKALLFPKSSRVINLVRGASEPDLYIQLTRGLTFLGVDFAMTLFGKPPGKYDVPRPLLDDFIADVEQDLKAAGLGPLSAPTF